MSELCSELGIKPVTLYRVRRAAGRVARAGREGPRHLNRSAASSPPPEHVFDLSVGFRPSRKTTRLSGRKRSALVGLSAAGQNCFDEELDVVRASQGGFVPLEVGFETVEPFVEDR